jgi:hypothetical protein
MSSYANSLANGDKKKLRKLKKIWRRAEEAAKKSYGNPTKKNSSKFWGTTTKIFKNMAHIKENEVKQFIAYLKEQKLNKKQSLKEMDGGSANVSGNIAKKDVRLPFNMAKQEREHVQQSEEIKKELGMKKKKKKHLTEMGGGAGGGSSGAMGGSFSGSMGAEGAQAAQASGYLGGTVSGDVASVGSALGTTSRIKFKKKKKKKHMKEEKEMSSEEQVQELDVDARQDKEIDDMLNGKVGPENQEEEDTDARQDKEIDAELSGKQPKSKKPKTAPVKPLRFDKSLKDSKTNANAPDTADSAEIDVLNASKQEDFSGYKILNEGIELPGKDAGEAEHNWDEYADNFGPTAEVIKCPIVDVKILKIGDEEVEEEPFDQEKEFMSSEEKELKVSKIPDDVVDHIEDEENVIDKLQKQIDDIRDILNKKASSEDYPREDAEQDKHFKDDISAGFTVKEVTGKDGKKTYDVVGNKTSYTYQSATDQKAADFWKEKLNSANKNPGAVKQDLQVAKEKGPEVGNKLAQTKTPEEKQKMLAASFSKLNTNKKMLLASANSLINKIGRINEKLTNVTLKAKILYISERKIVDNRMIREIGSKAISEKPHAIISKFLKEKKRKFVRDVKDYLSMIEEGYSIFVKKGVTRKDYFNKLEEKNNEISKSFNSLAYFFEAAFLSDYKKDVEEVDDLENTLDADKNIISAAKEEKKDLPDVKESNPLNATCPTCGSVAIGKDKQHSDEACAWCINGHKWNIKSGSLCGEVDIPADYRNVVYKDGAFVDKEDVINDNEEEITDEDIKKSEEQSAGPQKIEPPITEPAPTKKMISSPENQEEPEESEEVNSEEPEESEEVNSEEPEESEEVNSEEPEESEEVNSESEEVNSEEPEESEEVNSESESEEKSKKE